MQHTHAAPRNNLEAYEAIVPSGYFTKVRDNLAVFLSDVRSSHPHVNPVMVTLEYILQAEAVHSRDVYAALAQGTYDQALRYTHLYFDHVTLESHDDQPMVRLEFDAMRRWAVPGAREGAEIFWLAEFSALYSAPFDHGFLEALGEVVGNGSMLGITFEKTFARGTKQHDAIGRQFNSLMTHVKFFSM